MTPQVIIGLSLLLVGVVIKTLAAAGIIPGDVGFVGEVTNLGMLLLGKELMPASAASQKSRSIPPVAIVLLLALPLVASCTAKQVADVKNVARRVNDIARELCEATMGADAEAQGISVRDLCLLPHVIAPFLQAPRLAAANAKAGAQVDVCPVQQ